MESNPFMTALARAASLLLPVMQHGVGRDGNVSEIEFETTIGEAPTNG
jgi:hypothetical protein